MTIDELVQMYEVERILTDGEFISCAVCGCMAVESIGVVLAGVPDHLRSEILEVIQHESFGKGDEFLSSNGYHSVPQVAVDAVMRWRQGLEANL